MPEIWLRYGTTDIALDIRYENLYKELVPILTPDEQVNDKLQHISLKENSLIVVLSPSALTKQVLACLTAPESTKDISNVNVMTLPKFKGMVDIKNDKCNYSILSAKDLLSLRETMTKFQETLFISHSTYDPLFGFEGTPTHLLRNLNKVKMPEAIRLRSSDLPSPGIISEPYSLALSQCDDLVANSIEIVGNSNTLVDIYYDSIEESFKKSTSKLIENSVVDARPVKSVIVCPGCDPVHQYNLTDSLCCLWNCTSILKENSSAILLSEARGGLGSKAVEMLVEGKSLSPSTEHEGYIEGQEHLMFLEALRRKCKIGVVSTIPKYYLETKLGLDTFDSLKQVLARLLSKYGKNHKVTLIPEACYTLPRLDTGFKTE